MTLFEISQDETGFYAYKYRVFSKFSLPRFFNKRCNFSSEARLLLLSMASCKSDPKCCSIICPYRFIRPRWQKKTLNHCDIIQCWLNFFFPFSLNKIKNVSLSFACQQDSRLEKQKLEISLMRDETFF